MYELYAATEVSTESATGSAEAIPAEDKRRINSAVNFVFMISLSEDAWHAQ